MINAVSLALVTERVSRVLAIVETVAEPCMRAAAVLDGCPLEEVTPILDFLIRRSILVRERAYLRLTHKGRAMLADADAWRALEAYRAAG